MTETTAIDQRTFRKFCDLIYSKAGIKLGAQKEALVSARVSKRMRKLGMDDFREYYRFVDEDDSGSELVELLNAISTNTTHFFRESRHFDLLAQMLRRWEGAGQTRFRIWCAASSTGEEPYTIAMTVNESLADTRDTKILATDISTKVLDIAKAGIYDQKHVENVPKALLSKYFEKMGTGNSELGGRNSQGAVSSFKFQVSSASPPVSSSKFQASPDLRRLLTFARLNLSTPPFPMQGPFDVIFCRNVMIYFDNEVRRKLLAECYRLIKPGGYLMVGHAESLSGMLSEFKSVEPSVYTT